MVAARKAHAPERPTLRKEPRQRRGRARVEAILDAAARVFADQGYERATTEAIATEAGASIGSLYQYFPNKQAIFDALATRNLEDCKRLFDELLMPLVGRASWEELVALTIDGFWNFQNESPVFRAVWIRGTLSEDLIERGDAINRLFSERIAGLIALLAPEVPRARRDAAAQAVVETVSALLFVAARRKPAEAASLVAESKVMVLAYLDAVLRDAMPHPGKAKPARKSRTLP